MVSKPKHSCSPVDCRPWGRSVSLRLPCIPQQVLARETPATLKLIAHGSWVTSFKTGANMQIMLPFWHTNHSHYKSNCPIVMSKQMSRWWRTDGGVTQRTTWVNTQPLGLDCTDSIGLPSEEGSAIESLMISLQPAVLDQFSIYSFPKMVLVFDNHITHSSMAEPSQIWILNTFNTCDQGWNNQ